MNKMSDEFFPIFFDGMTKEEVQEKLDEAERKLNQFLEWSTKTIEFHEEFGFKVPKEVEVNHEKILERLYQLKKAKTNLFGIKKPNTVM